MKTLLTSIIILVFSLSSLAQGSSATDTKHPSKLTKEQIAGTVFDSKDVEKYKDELGRKMVDFYQLYSSDKKFAVGMTTAPAGKLEYLDHEYGTDEMMYFISGGVTLTSEDGTVLVVGEGECATLAKEWKGTWDTQGYTKIWVIYSREGGALE
ncbi:MAG: DUF861 domain-containing protein [Flavobacteriales bacterium]|nr:DUF861 domain-containing protein [Flavobacteriales bacterium]